MRLFQKWDGREIIYSPNMQFTLQGHDTLNLDLIKCKYKIVTYVDSVGCVSCKLNLQKWMDFASEIDSISLNGVCFQFIFQPYRLNELLLMLKQSQFKLPVCIDLKNQFSQLNNFPEDEDFHSFLLDQYNKVIAIGNPTFNFKIREFYLKIIQGEKVEQDKGTEVINTQVTIDKTSISLGRFNWQEEQKAIFTLRNTGNKPLVVQDINTSCGCTSVSYPKEPVQSGRELKLEVTYKAEHPEHFNKTVTVYCNAESSPLVLKIMGDAE